MPDETFLPQAELRAYSYRGAYGQAVAGPNNDSMNPGMGCCGLAGVETDTATVAKVGLVASLGMAFLDKKKRRGVWIGAAVCCAIGMFADRVASRLQ